MHRVELGLLEREQLLGRVGVVRPHALVGPLEDRVPFCGRELLLAVRRRRVGPRGDALSPRWVAGGVAGSRSGEEGGAAAAMGPAAVGDDASETHTHGAKCFVFVPPCFCLVCRGTFIGGGICSVEELCPPFALSF